MSSFLGDETTEDNSSISIHKGHNNFSTHAASVTTTFANIANSKHKRRTTFLASLEQNTSNNSSRFSNNSLDNKSVPNLTTISNNKPIKHTNHLYYRTNKIEQTISNISKDRKDINNSLNSSASSSDVLDPY